MEEKKPMIRCVDVKKIYNKGKENQLEALAGVSCEIWPGELVAVMGKSGCGKSTLLHILGCLDTLDGGDYQLNGKKMEAARDREMARIRNEQIGIVLQDFALVEEFTAMENVLLPLDFSAKRSTERKHWLWRH
ncbi:MAG: ABC transporter ATP-binding protein [Lachnospiraceae bacterium]